MTPLRIILADDHRMVRAGIRSLLEKIPRVEVVAEAGDGGQALALLKSHPADILLIDITMPGLNGLETAAEVALSFPQVKVVILSVHAHEEYVVQALRAGVAGYLLKDSAAGELELALDALQRNETYLSPVISRAVIDGYLGRVSDGQPWLKLTPRQAETLRLIAEGRTVKEIALNLDLSVKTVEAHRAQMMARLGIYDIPGLVRYAMRAGLIPPEG